MAEKQNLTSIGPPVPELPVVDVERAQQHYRDALGFEIGWLYPDKGIGAVMRPNMTIFFRKRQPPFEPAIHWMFAPDIDASYEELKSLGADIVDPLETKPWGIRQFTVKPLLYPSRLGSSSAIPTEIYLSSPAPPTDPCPLSTDHCLITRGPGSFFHADPAARACPS